MTAAGAACGSWALVHHTDAEREWAYDRESQSATDKAHEAPSRGWVVTYEAELESYSAEMICLVSRSLRL